MNVIIGMDPHKRSATIEVIDPTGRVLATGRYGTTGYPYGNAPRPKLWWGYHNHMALKKTTVMVDEHDLELIKQAAAREGRPESEYFREAFHLAAIRTRRWQEDWDIPVLDLGRPISAEEIHRTVADEIVTDQDR
ncbi:hypothetical protein ACFV4K_16570 [Nocardia sp. NPDC059764]|uniref:hypothetical protein n=1 Tax=Nocardia sp. NPDC059764 TaxID=3346939 RepID=UPI003664C1C1